MSSETVRAAGGIVLRDDGRLAVIHRPRYDDWSLPKGKPDPGEALDATALREVEEETGLRCRLRERAGETRYVDRNGQTKIVEYWLMEPADELDLAGTFEANEEADSLRWCTDGEAASLLTYARDRDLVAHVLSRLADASSREVDEG